MIEFINKNRNVLLGVVAAAVAGFGFFHWVGDTESLETKNNDESVAESNNDESFEEIVVIGEAKSESDFAEKANEAAVKSQVNAAQKLSDDTDGLSEK